MKKKLFTAVLIALSLASCSNDPQDEVVIIKKPTTASSFKEVSSIITPMGNGTTVSIASTGPSVKSVSPESLGAQPTSGSFGTYKYVLFNWSFAYEGRFGPNWQWIIYKTLPQDVEVLNTDHNYLCHYVFAYDGPDNFGYYLDYFYNFEERTDANGQTYKVITGEKNHFCNGCWNCQKCMPWGCWCGCGGWNNDGTPILRENPNFAPNYNPGQSSGADSNTDDSNQNDNPEVNESDDIKIELPIANLAEYVIQPDDFYLRSNKLIPQMINGEEVMAPFFRSVAVQPHSSEFVKVAQGDGEKIKIDISGLNNLYSAPYVDSLGGDSIWTYEVYIWPAKRIAVDGETNDDGTQKYRIESVHDLTDGYYLSSVSDEIYTSVDTNGVKYNYRLNSYADFSNRNYCVKATAYIGTNGKGEKTDKYGNTYTDETGYQYLKLSIHIARKGGSIEDPVQLHENEWVGYNF